MFFERIFHLNPYVIFTTSSPSILNLHAYPLRRRYCWWLVDNGIFKKVKVCFLLVGHTHENIDQLFSRMAVSLRKSDVWTMNDLAAVGRGCFTPTPLVAFVEAGYDWDKYCKGADNVQQIHDISYSHNFKVWYLYFSYGHTTLATCGYTNICSKISYHVYIRLVRWAKRLGWGRH